METEIINKWIDEALKQDLHEQIFIPVVSKVDGKALLKQFQEEYKILQEVDPQSAGSLLISMVFKDSHFWILLERVIGNPLIGFKKSNNGKLERISLSYDPEKERRDKLMKEDGYLKEEEEE